MQTMKIKYRDVDTNGQLKGFLFSKKGRIDEQALTLSDMTIPTERLIGCETRDKRIVIAFHDATAPGGAATVIEVYKPSVKKLEQAINRSASDHELLRRQQKLEELGRADEIRTSVCPSCDATIDLTGHTQTPECFCPYCGAVANEGVAPKERVKVQMCDSCGFFAFPRGITCFYFYFLVFFYGFRHQRKHMCSTCMRAEGWKMLAGNLIFILGVPVALTQLGRAYFGGSSISGGYRGLEAANVAARKGKAEKAQQGYNAIVERLGVSAVAHTNAGLAFARVDELPKATEHFENALLNCGNFTPAAKGLAATLAAQGHPLEDHPLLAPFRSDEASSDSPALGDSVAHPAAH